MISAKVISIRLISRRMGYSLDCVFCHSHREGHREGNVKNLCICAGCRARTYHRSCWPKTPFHRSSNRSTTVCPPPIDFAEYVWINYLLQPRVGQEQQAALHRQEMWSSWFNVPNQQDSPEFYIFPRLQWLIDNAQELRDDSMSRNQFPSLVSFFGDTG